MFYDCTVARNVGCVTLIMVFLKTKTQPCMLRLDCKGCDPDPDPDLRKDFKSQRHNVLVCVWNKKGWIQSRSRLL